MTLYSKVSIDLKLKLGTYYDIRLFTDVKIEFLKSINN